MNYRATIIMTCIAACSLFSHAAFAQFTQEELISNDVTIKFTPSQPQPNETVTAKASSFSFDVARSKMTWFVNGKQVASGTGKDTVTFTTGAAGSKTTLSVSVVSETGDKIERTLTLYPSSLDVLWSANSYTPPGYPGKALPTIGSTVMFIALPKIASGQGKLAGTASLAYEWTLDGRILRDQSGIGRDAVSVRISSNPGLQHEMRLIVTENSTQTKHEKVVRFRVQEKKLAIYQVDPLRGPVNQAVGQNVFYLPSGAEAKFVAVPFFFTSPASLLYQWRVNGNAINNTGIFASPSFVYRTQAGSSGRQIISIQVTNPNNPFELANNYLTIDVR